MWRPLISCLGVFPLHKSDSSPPPTTALLCHTHNKLPESFSWFPLDQLHNNVNQWRLTHACKPPVQAWIYQRIFGFSGADCLFHLAKAKAHATNVAQKPCLTLKLAIGHKWATESDPSNVGAQIRHSLQHTSSWVGVKVGVLNHELSDAGENSCQSHKAVEGCHKLWQVCDFNTLRNGETWSIDMKINPK